MYTQEKTIQRRKITLDQATFDQQKNIFEHEELGKAIPIKYKNAQERKNFFHTLYPFNMNVKTNVGMLTLKLIDKHFPKNNELNEIFNRNTIKISYSTMKNMRSSIIGMNKKKLECASQHYIFHRH